MVRFPDVVTNQVGTALPGAFVTVRNSPSGTLAAITADNGTALPNPLTADGSGAYYFNAPVGLYSLEFRLLSFEPARKIRIVDLDTDTTALAVGLFVNSATFNIPLGVVLLQTSGYSVVDKGAAILVYDAAVNSAYVAANPLISFLYADGRGFRLSLEQDITPEMCGALGGGADDTAAVAACFNYAFANGGVADGLGKTFAVTGDIRCDNFTRPQLSNIELLQLSPNGTVGGVPTVDRRTLFFNTCTEVRLKNVRVNRGTDKTSGSLSSAAGIYIEGGNGHFLSDVRVHGDGQGSGIVMDGCSDCLAENVVGHDMAFDSVSATDDLIMGVWVNACTDCTFIGLKGYNLTGNATGFPTNRFTRGIAVSGCIRCSFVSPNCYNVDQGMDVTGEPAGNSFVTITGMRMYTCASWGLKLANTGFSITVDGGTCRDCGLSAVVVSGPTGTGDTYKGEHITVQNVFAYNTGSNGASWGSHIGFRVMPGGSADGTGYPRGVTFANCTAIDDQGTPTMTTGFSNEVTYDGSKRLNRIVNCRSIGHITATSSGFHRPYCKVNGTSTQSIADSSSATPINWDTEVEDTMGMHSTVTGTNLIVVPLTGEYEVRANISYASNATGYRQAIIFKNSVSTGLLRSLSAITGVVTNVYIQERIILSAGDAIAVAPFQNSGGALNVDRTASWLAVELVRES